MSSDSVAVGIDLGTTNCSVAILQKGQVKVIPNEYGDLTTPSVVAFKQSGRLVGRTASEQLVVNPLNSVFNVKRLIGRRTEGLKQEWPFTVLDVAGCTKISIPRDSSVLQLSPEEVSAMLLRKLKVNAEQHLGRNVTHAVITVPAGFSHTQRQATIDAGNIAGLEVLKLVNEPSAVAIAYGTHQSPSLSKVLVFNMGGGFTDVSVLYINGGLFEVQSMAGDDHLGGEDFDWQLVRHFVQEISLIHNKTLTAKALALLRRECERIKRELSNCFEAFLRIDSLLDGFDFQTIITRDEFEIICSDLFQRALKPVSEALAIEGIDKRSVNSVILVGGATRMPKLQSLLREYFEGKDVFVSPNMDVSAVYGAATQAAFLIGDKSVSDRMFFLEELSSHSFSFESTGGAMNNLIKRNSKIPCTKVVPVTTSFDYCTTLSYNIFEGEAQLSKDNVFLGTFGLIGIPSANKFIPEIKITFKIDTNGCLNLSAKVDCFGVVKELQVSQETGKLTESEIERLRRELPMYDLREQDYPTNVARSRLKKYAVGVQMAVTKACEDAMKWASESSSAGETEIDEMMNRLKLLCISYISEGVSPS